MKELTIEQKALKYDEALKKAKNIIEINQTISDIVECVESLFPELAEVENGRIRKEILEAEYERGRDDTISKMKNQVWIEKEPDCNTPNNPQITIGTRIRSKTNPNVILSIISNDCHEDEFECSNGSVLSLEQIEKYYDIYIEEK